MLDKDAVPEIQHDALLTDTTERSVGIDGICTESALDISNTEVKSEDETSNSSTDSASEGNDICLPIPIKEESSPDVNCCKTSGTTNRGSFPKSTSSTDTASEGDDVCLPVPIKEESTLDLECNKPKNTRSCFKSTSNLTEAELIRMLEEESPDLTPELMFSKPPAPPLKKLRYLGDITVDDFQNKKAKIFLIKTKRKVAEIKKEIKDIQSQNRRLEKKIAKLNKVLKFLKDTCSDLEVDDVTCMDISEDEGTDEEISSEGDENSIPLAIHNDESKDKDDDDVLHEQKVREFSLFDSANQVQVTFSRGNCDNLKALEKKLESLAHDDVRLSQQIFHLNNTIFRKNKIIEELQLQLAKLQDETR